MLAALRPGGVVLVNAPWKSWEEMEPFLSQKTKTRVTELKPQVGTAGAKRGQSGRVEWAGQDSG